MKLLHKFISSYFKYEKRYIINVYAGVLTSLLWGFMLIQLYSSFYQSNPDVFPLQFQQLVNYIWLQQILLPLIIPWSWDFDIIRSIRSGNMSIELIKPISIYRHWFTRCLASRIAKVSMRILPFLIIVILLPNPYRLVITFSSDTVLFVIALINAALIIVALSMIIYTMIFKFIEDRGIRILYVSICQLFSGGVLPLIFFPKWLFVIAKLLPFSYIQDVVYNVFNGMYDFKQSLMFIVIQWIWLIILIPMGYFLLQQIIKHVEVQGG